MQLKKKKKNHMETKLMVSINVLVMWQRARLKFVETFGNKIFYIAYDFSMLNANKIHR